MYGLPEERWLSWKRKRKQTLIGFVLVGTLMGIDCSVITSTLFLYLRDTLKTANPTMWYGVITSCLFVSSTISGAVCGRWLDRTRNVRIYTKLTLTVQIIGFLIYTIPYHPAILLTARLISGIGDPFTNVVSGEVFRIYDEKGRTTAMLLLASIYSFGFIIGPGLNFLFKGVHFHIGPILVNNLNFIGIFQSLLLLLVMVVSHFLVHNCSQEFDLKEHIALHGEDDDEIVNSDKKSVEEGSTKMSIKTEDICEGKVSSYTNGGCEDCGCDNSASDVRLTKKNEAELEKEGSDATSASTNHDSEKVACEKVIEEEGAASSCHFAVTTSENRLDPLTHKTLYKDDDSLGVSSRCVAVITPPMSKETPEDTPTSETIGHQAPSTPQKEIKNRPPPQAPKSEIIPLPIVLRTLIWEPNTLLVFIATFVFVYTIMVASMLMPIIVEGVLDWSLNTFNVLYTSFGIVDFFFICLMTKVCTTPRSIYYASLVSITSQIFTCALLICLKLLPRSYSRDMALVVAFFVSIMIGWLFDDVLVRVILANFVPSQIQSFSEALRSGVCKLSMIAGSVTVAMLWSWVHWWSSVITLLNIVLFVAFVIRAKHFIKPCELKLSTKGNAGATPATIADDTGTATVAAVVLPCANEVNIDETTDVKT